MDWRTWRTGSALFFFVSLGNADKFRHSVQADLDPAVYAFLIQELENVQQLEALLQVFKTEEAWTILQLAEKLRMSEPAAARALDALHRRGLFKAEGGEYRRSDDQQLRARVEAVERAYAERRLSVINLISERALERMRSFSRAFKLGKKDGG